MYNLCIFLTPYIFIHWNKYYIYMKMNPIKYVTIDLIHAPNYCHSFTTKNLS